jgi:apolipoprotein N-acyltransferase
MTHRGWRDRLVPPAAGWLLVSAVLLGLAFPPFHLVLPSFTAFVPLLVWIAERPAGWEGLRQARQGGLFVGLLYGTIIYYGLVVALLVHSPLAALAFLAPVLAIATLISLVALATGAARTKLGWPIWLAFPVFWTAYEWFRAYLPGFSFPWMQLGDSLTGYPQLVGAADVVGSRGLSLWLALANSLLATALIAWRRGGWTLRVIRPLVAFLVVLAAPIGYSIVRWNSIELRPVARATVIQPSVPQHVKRDPQAAADSAVRATETLLGRLGLESQPGGTDLLILPETVFPAYIEALPSLDHPGRPDLEAWVAGVARRLDAPVLYGALGAADRGSGSFDRFNSAFLVNAAGNRVGRYDKQYLVPVVERVPILDLIVPGKRPGAAGFGRGSDAAPMRIEAGSFGVMICYESIYARIGRQYRREGADFLVNITNDAWFGRQAGWTHSSFLWQHPAHLVMRAIESRVGIARSGNTGISQAVDPLGRTSHTTELFAAAAFVAELHTTDGQTPYVRYGDVAGWTSMLVALACLGLLGHEWRASRRAGPSA